MDARVKKLWIDALRSDEYQKGIGALRRRSGDSFFYCCLGVLCDLHAKETGGEWKIGESFPNVDEIGGYGESICFLPLVVCGWSRLTNVNPNLTVPLEILNLMGRGSTFSCTYLNDETGMSFTTIADLIEQQL